MREHERHGAYRDGSPVFLPELLPYPLEEYVAVVDASVGHPLGGDAPMADRLFRAGACHSHLSHLEEAAGSITGRWDRGIYTPDSSLMVYGNRYGLVVGANGAMWRRRTFAERLTSMGQLLESGPGFDPAGVEKNLSLLEHCYGIPLGSAQGTPAERIDWMLARVDAEPFPQDWDWDWFVEPDVEAPEPAAAGPEPEPAQAPDVAGVE